MKLQFGSKYKTTKDIGFPFDSIGEDQKKDKEYFKQCATTILTKFVNNKCWTPYNDDADVRSVSTLRKYATGSVGAGKYQDLLIGKKGRDGRREKTTVNISWDTMKIIPQKIDVVVGYFLKMRFDTETSAIDYQSSSSKQTILSTMKLIAGDTYKAKRDEINALVGMPVAQDPQMPEGAMQGSPLQFKNEKQVELFASMGGVFLQQEAAIFNLLEKSNDESGWPVIYEHLIRDEVTLGVACARVRGDKNGHVVLKDYVDMEYAILPNSKYNDFRDMTWAGEIQKKTIAELREESKLSDKELVEIARKYAAADGTVDAGFYSDAQRFKDSGGFSEANMLGQISVDVIDVRWIGTAEETYTYMNRRETNNMVFNRVKENTRISNNARRQGKEKATYSRQVVYKAKMVVGSEYVFDYGVDEFLSYQKDFNGKMRVVFPYRAYKTGTRSLVDRCISFEDDANLSLFKLRVAKKKMPAPPNLMIKKSALENVSIDGLTYQPQQLFKLFQDEGFLIVDDQNAWGQNVSQSKAIDTVPTDMIRQIAEWRLDIDANIKMIEIVTGINDIFSAQSPSAETGLGVTRIAINATSNALFPITNAIVELFAGIKRCEVAKWQVVAKYISDKERERLSINRALQYIKISTDLDSYDFDIRIEVSPNEDDKLQLLQDIARMRDMRRQAGVGGITPSDYMMIWNIIKTGNVKQAQMLLAQIEEMRSDEDKEMENKRVQDNMQSQMMSNQQTAENQAQLQQGEADLNLRNQIEIERAKAQFKMEENRRKAQDERQTAAVQNLWGWSSRDYTKANR